jgi:phosphoserine phosphatase
MNSFRDDTHDLHPDRGALVDSQPFVETDPAELSATLRRRVDAPLLLDLDETLVLRSTTHAFIDAARPSSVVAVALHVVERLRPWRILPGGSANRDWVRILVVVVLTPWSLVVWRRTAGRWAAMYRNEELAQLVRAHDGPVLVVTRGFRPIVQPVVEGLRLPHLDLVACSVLRWRGQRHISKFQMLARSPHAELVDTAVCVTDSLDDSDLLGRVATPVLVTWPGAEQIEPLRNAYVPFRYTHETRSPKGAFVRAAFLTDDLYVTVLAFSVVAWWFPLRAIGLVLASIALWIVYETGYHENDRLGAMREADPVLPDNFEEMRDTVGRVGPYVWAAGFTIAAAPFLVIDSLSVRNVATTAVLWAGVIVVVRAVFALFNRLPEPHRVVPHLLLQVGKCLGFAVVVPLAGLIGLALCVAQIGYRWIPYAQYRWTSSVPSGEPLVVTRLWIFLAVAVPSLLVVDHSVGDLVVFAASLAFVSKRAVPALRRRTRSSSSVSSAPEVA